MAEVLRVAGARLSYSVHGSGPVVALVPAGAATAGSYLRIAGPLAERFTVLTYDRRGAGGSVPDDPARPIEVATHTEDLVRLLESTALGPARVFGRSGGAVVRLALAARRP